MQEAEDSDVEDEKGGNKGNRGDGGGERERGAEVPVATEAAERGEKEKEARTGDIHCPKLRSFWEGLKPGTWVTNLLQNGYKIPFRNGTPERYREENNASAKKNMAFVQVHVQTEASEQGRGGAQMKDPNVCESSNGRHKNPREWRAKIQTLLGS